MSESVCGRYFSIQISRPVAVAAGDPSASLMFGSRGRRGDKRTENGAVTTVCTWGGGTAGVHVLMTSCTY